MAKAQSTKNNSILVGESFSFQSKAFEQELTLQVHLPASYANSGKSYPVLYIFDGEVWFLHGVSLTKMLHHFQYVPEMIIVGLSNPSRRYQLFSQPEKVTDVLQNEIYPLIQSKWRASSERLLLGWQFAGASLLNLVSQQHPIASGFFAASPYPISIERLDALKSKVTGKSQPNSTLLFSSSVNENQVREQTLALEKLLNAEYTNNMRWRFLTLNSDPSVSAAHRTTPIETLYQGLRFYFSDYAELEFDSEAELLSAGGLSYVEEYYKRRADKYDLSAEVPHEGVFNLLRMSMRGGHVDTFSTVMQQFGSTEFLAQTNLGWSMQYAKFYLDNNRPSLAADLYQNIAKRFPEHPAPVRGLAEAALATDQPQQAIAWYRKAISLSKQSAAPNTTDLESRLQQLLNSNKETL